MKKGKIIIVVVAFVVIAGLAVTAYFKFGNKSEEKATVVTESSLKEAVEISDLSTAEFIYNGIAEVKKENKDKIDYQVKYNATVKVGIDFSEIEWDIDEENKKIKPILPEIIIKDENINVDTKGMSFIPDDAKGDLNQARSACEADVKKEASNCGELFEMAKDNLQRTVEALIKPLIEKDGKLATLKCYFHNVTEYEKDASKAGKLFGNIGYKKIWFEYDGIATYSIDASKLRIENPDEETGVVKVYIPSEVSIETNVRKDSISEPVTDLGWFTSVSLKEKNEALDAAQDNMKKTAEANEDLKNQAYQKAKKIIEDYVIKTGEITGHKYTVQWLDK